MIDGEWISLGTAFRQISKALKDVDVAECRLLEALADSKINAVAELFRVFWLEGGDDDRSDFAIVASVWRKAKLGFGKNDVEFDVGHEPPGYYYLFDGELKWHTPSTTDELWLEPGADAQGSTKGSDFDGEIDQLDDEPRSYKAFGVRLNADQVFKEFPTARPRPVKTHQPALEPPVTVNTNQTEAKIAPGAGDALAKDSQHSSKIGARVGAPMIHDWVAAAAYVAAYHVAEGSCPSTIELEMFFKLETKSVPDRKDLRKFITTFDKMYEKRMTTKS